MEELFVYAILCSVGFEKYDKYEDTYRSKSKRKFTGKKSVRFLRKV